MYTTAQVFCLASLCGQTKHKEYVSQEAFSYSAQLLLCSLYNKHWWGFGPSLFQLSFCCCLLAKTGFSMGVHTEYKWTCLNLMVTTGIPFFMEIFIFAAWELWKLRNSKIFDQGRPTVSLWFRKFKSQVLLQLVRVREDQRPCIIQWLESL